MKSLYENMAIPFLVDLHVPTFFYGGDLYVPLFYSHASLPTTLGEREINTHDGAFIEVDRWTI
jgi:hypothetical protein